jgi:hypothetical protein
MSAATKRKATREEIAQRILVASALLGGLLGGGLVLAKELHLDVPLPVFGGIVAGLLALVLPLTAIYWRMIDEAAREAHKFAWFWGGQGGICVVLVWGMFGGAESLTAQFSDLKAAGWVVIGMAVLMIGQVIGYGLVWAGWWLRQR